VWRRKASHQDFFQQIGALMQRFRGRCLSANADDDLHHCFCAAILC